MLKFGPKQPPSRAKRTGCDLLQTQIAIWLIEELLNHSYWVRVSHQPPDLQPTRSQKLPKGDHINKQRLTVPYLVVYIVSLSYTYNLYVRRCMSNSKGTWLWLSGTICLFQRTLLNLFYLRFFLVNAKGKGVSAEGNGSTRLWSRKQALLWGLLGRRAGRGRSHEGAPFFWMRQTKERERMLKYKRGTHQAKL